MFSFVFGFNVIPTDDVVHRVVLANGSTRLQMDIVKSSNLPFHMLFSSQLLGKTKVSPGLRSLRDLLGGWASHSR